MQKLNGIRQSTHIINKPRKTEKKMKPAIENCALVPLSIFLTGGIPWVPHYSKKDTYVAPGGVERTGTVLEALGAKKSVLSLWPRRWMGDQ